MNFLLTSEGGIYKIENTDNNSIYIGSSINVNKRTAHHFMMLKANKHKNRKMQASFNIHGENKFAFSLLEYVERDKLIEREEWWYNYYKSINYCFYNTGEFLRNPMLGVIMSLESRLKMTSARLGRYRGENCPKFGKHVSMESRLKMSLAKKGTTPWNKGVPRTDEEKRRISESKKAKMTDEKRKKISEAKKGIPSKRKGVPSGIIPWNKGKTGVYSKEALQKMSRTKIERNRQKKDR